MPRTRTDLKNFSKLGCKIYQKIVAYSLTCALTVQCITIYHRSASADILHNKTLFVIRKYRKCSVNNRNPLLKQSSMLFNLLRYRLNRLGYPAAMHSAVRRAVYPVKFNGFYSALVILIAACHGKHTLVNLFAKIFWYVCPHSLSLLLILYSFSSSVPDLP